MSGQAYPNTGFVHLVGQCYQRKASDMCHIDLKDAPQCKLKVVYVDDWREIWGLRTLGMGEELGATADSWGAERGVGGLLEWTGDGFELEESHEELNSLACRSHQVLFQGHKAWSDSEDEILCKSIDSQGGSSAMASIGVTATGGGVRPQYCCSPFKCLWIAASHILSVEKEERGWVSNHGRELGLSGIPKGRASSISIGLNSKW